MEQKILYKAERKIRTRIDCQSRCWDTIFFSLQLDRNLLENEFYSLLVNYALKNNVSISFMVHDFDVYGEVCSQCATTAKNIMKRMRKNLLFLPEITEAN